MFIAHLPAGYLLTRFITQRVKHPEKSAWFMAAGLVGSVFPDIDMLYFYLIDMRLHHHHQYWTHIPSVWLIILIPLIGVSWITRHHFLTQTVALFGLNIMFHLLLDTVVGDIWWLSPWINHPYRLFTVPALYSPWQLNFLLHWSFALELAIAWFAWRQYRASRH